MSDFNFDNFNGGGESGLDIFLSDVAPFGEARAKVAAERMFVSSLGDLDQFVRIASDTLIHKSDRDLWALKQDESGNHYIERLFDDQGDPLKG